MSEESIAHVGSASVSIVPSTEGFTEKLRAELEPKAGDVGEAIGRALGEAMYRRIDESILEVRARLAELGTTSVDIRVHVDDNGSAATTAARVEAVGAASNNSSGGVNSLSNAFGNVATSTTHAIGLITVLGPTIAAMTAAAIPGVLALGAALGGLVVGAGVLALGLHGVGGALSAANTPSGGGGGGTAIPGAALSAQSARISAAQATQSAGDQLRSALSTQGSAEIALVKAQRDAIQAQKDLTQARIDAKRAIEDLDNKVTDNALAQREAAIKLDEARRNLALVKAAPGAVLPQYADQVAQAQLDFDKAKQSLAELQQTSGRLATDDAAAKAKGISGSALVVSANTKVTDTQNALHAAQKAVVDSTYKVNEAQANIGITAQKNAIALQQAALGMQSAAAGADAFGQAMKQLNPLQQQFVDFLLSLKPLLGELKLAASGFLPGLQAGIQAALPAFNLIVGVISAVARALGDVFKQIGQQFVTPEGKKFLTFLATELPQQIMFLGQVFIELGRIFASIWEAFAPLIHAVDKAFLGFLKRVADSFSNGGLNGFVSFVKSVMPQVAGIFKDLGQIIVQVFDALQPAIQPSLVVLKAIGDALVQLAGPVIQPLAKAFGDLILALEPLIAPLVQLIKAILPPLVGFFDQLVKEGLTPIVKTLVQAIAPVLPQVAKSFDAILKALAPLIKPLTDIFVKAIQTLAPFLPRIVDALSQMALAFANLLVALMPIIGPLTNLLLKIITPAAVNTLLVFAGAATAILNAFTALARYISGAVKDIGGAISTIKDVISGALGDPLKILHDVGKNIIQGLINGMVDAAKNLPDIVGNVGKSVADGFKSIFKINSPSLLMSREVGSPIVEGIAHGITQNTHFVYKAMDNVARGVSKFAMPTVNTAGINGGTTSTARIGVGGQGAAGGFNVGGITINTQSDPVATARATSQAMWARAV